MAKKKNSPATDKAEIAQAPAPLTARPITVADWPAIVELFGDKGACGGCWCMWPRVPKGGNSWEDAKGAKNRERFRRLVKAGQVHAVLAFAGEQPVGWCSFGPRSTFPRFDGVKALKKEYTGDTWAVVCFYIHPKWRGKGVGAKLLEFATEQAFALGAKSIEGYPVVPKDPAKPMPSVFAWTGVPALFDKLGYEELNRPGATRPIFVKNK